MQDNDSSLFFLFHNTDWDNFPHGMKINLNILYINRINYDLESIE